MLIVFNEFEHKIHYINENHSLIIRFVNKKSETPTKFLPSSYKVMILIDISQIRGRLGRELT
jgi:hypothetical protein